MELKIAYFCLFLVAMLPYFCAISARIVGKYNVKKDNISPRDFFDNLTWIAKRFDFAQKNSFEILSVFIVAFFVALHSGISPKILMYSSILFVISRIFYIFAYIKNLSNLRSGLFFFGFGIIIFLFISAIF